MVVAVQRDAALLARAVGCGRNHQVLDAHIGKVPRIITSWLPRREP
jgi:hypothetical protein